MGSDNLNLQDDTESAMAIYIMYNPVKVTKMETNIQTKTKNKIVTSISSHKKVFKKNIATPTRSTATKVHDSLESLINRRLKTYITQGKFLQNYNDLKLSQVKMQLEIAKMGEKTC